MNDRVCLLAAVAALIAGPLCLRSACADTVTVGERTYDDVRISAFAGGELTFVESNGRTLAAWISDVHQLYVDSVSGFLDFNEAEKFVVEEQEGKALIRYERALRISQGFWNDIVTCRMLSAYDHVGRLDRAALYYIKLVRSDLGGESAAILLMPGNIPSQQTQASTRAVQQLDAAMRSLPSEAKHDALALLRYRMLEATNKKREAAERNKIAAMRLPPAVRFAPAYEIQLEALGKILAANATSNRPADVTRWLDHAIADCPEPMLPRFLWLKGKTLMRDASSREDIIRATWPLMRIAIHFPNDPLAAAGLFETARAMQRLDRPEKAAALLDECLAHPGIDVSIRAKAINFRQALREARQQKAEK